MIIWVDAQLSPALARWISETFSVQAQAVRDLGLRDAKDPEIFRAARQEGIVVLSKDSDFVGLVERLALMVRLGLVERLVLVETCPRS